MTGKFTANKKKKDKMSEINFEIQDVSKDAAQGIQFLSGRHSLL